MVQIKTLIDIDIQSITDTFNLSFSDYFVPVCLTPEQLSDKMKIDQVNLNYSVGAFEGERLIAFILHGTDIINAHKVVYNGGTGVIPEKRGSGLTRQMYNYILPLLKKEEVDFLILEAISKNIPAIKSYEKVGFHTERVLKCYKGLAMPEKTSKAENKEISRYDWYLMKTFWNFEPSWQNSIRIMNELSNHNFSLGAYIDDRLVGYLIYNPGSRRIQQLAVDRNFRRMGIASGLIKDIIRLYEKDMAVINVDKSSESMHCFLLKLGLENYLDQVEMKLNLK